MSKKVTSKDVAIAAGVSQSLVSLILNNVPNKKIKPETRELVYKAARELNYQVNVNARNMKSRKAGAVGLLSEWDTQSFVFSPVIDGVQAACSENDIGVVICTGREGVYKSKDYLEYYLQNRIDGLIYVSYVGVTKQGVIQQLEENAIPFVCIIGARDLSGVSCVDVSFIESGYMAVQHLSLRGYRRIAYILPQKPSKLNYGERERLEGCTKAAQENGVKLDCVESFIGVSDESELEKVSSNLLNSELYDAVVSTSYSCFILLKTAIKENINVPRSIGIISLDNEMYAPYLYPSLTTIDKPLTDIAKKATHLLLDKIKGQTICEKIELTPLLSIRESTSKD